MALLGNYTIFTKNPIFLSGGDSTTGIQFCRYNFNQAGVSRLRFYGENNIVGVSDRCGLPANYSAPYSWILPPKAGGIGSNVGLQGSGTATGSGALGINIDATMSGNGDISSANLGLILSAVATLSGIGGLSADIVGALNASATLAGQGDMSGSLGALAGAVATLSGSGSMNNDITALAFLSADIYVNQSEASVQQIVDGVWNALASQYNTSGTMGEAAQTGGGGGGGATAAQIWSYSSRTLTENAGLSTEEHNKLMSLNGVGFINNSRYDYGATDRKMLEEIKEELKKPKQEVDFTGINKKLSEIDYHNSLARDKIIARIDEVETEVCSDIVRSKKEIKEDNVKTRELVRQKTKKLDENTQKLADRQDLTDKLIEDEADEIEDDIERLINEEADMIEQEAQIEKEIQDIESELNSNTSTNGND